MASLAKNRHLNLGLQAELYVRTGTYDRPKNTLAIDSACAPLDSAIAATALANAPRSISLRDTMLTNLLDGR